MSDTSEFVDDVMQIQSELQQELKNDAIAAAHLLHMMMAEKCAHAVDATLGDKDGCISYFNKAVEYKFVRLDIIERFKLTEADLQV